MGAYSVFRGSPQFSNVLQRDRVSRFVGTAGDKPVVLAAPSGSGKTVALAHFAAAHDLPCLWAPLGGANVDYPSFMSAACSALDGMEGDRRIGDATPPTDLLVRFRTAALEHCPDGMLVILDDAGFSSAEVVEFARRFTSDHAPAGVRLLISMRQSELDDSRLHVVGARHLALSDDEVGQLARLFGRNDMDLDAAVRIGRSCSGHPAITCTMLATLDETGDVSLHPSPAVALAMCIADEYLSPDERRTLDVLRIVRRATVSQLERCGLRDVSSAARRLALYVPLVRTECPDVGASTVVSAHDLLCEQNLSALTSDRIAAAAVDPVVLLTVMAENAESDRLALLATSPCLSDPVADWLESEPEVSIAALGPQGVLTVFDAIPLSRVLRRARLMFLWSRILGETGRMDNAIAKGRIACRLAEQDADIECLCLSVAVVTRCMAAAGRPKDAWEFGSAYLSGASADCEPWLRCEQLAALGEAAAMSGAHEDFSAIEALARECVARDPLRTSRSLRRIDLARAALIVATTGSWAQVGRVIAPLLEETAEMDVGVRDAAKSLMAASLVESGRLLRARGLLESMVNGRGGLAHGSNMPLLGMVMAAEGDLSGAVRTCELGVSRAVAEGHDVVAGRGRIALSLLRRLAGDLPGALECAERAYESLNRLGVAGHRSLAALEVAAVLLAMNDVSAARHWVSLAEPAAAGSVEGYHGMRAALVLAECDRRDGEADSGIERLKKYLDHVRSEDSNWQTAIYARTFPHLMGMIAAAVGTRNLPSHMLTLVPSDEAERCLRAARALMADEEWRVLGNRILGTERFAEFVARKGRTLCRVRLFGGLEVSDGERVLRERDWTKRKGRLLFAMLVAGRGQEVSRESILEHLWPHLDEDRAKNNFYVAWSSMKKALVPGEERSGACPYVQSMRGRCRIVTELVRSDLDDFEDAVARARVAESERRVGDALESYAALVAVYRGDLLPGDLFDDWFTPLREKYRTAFVEAMGRATNLMLAHGDPTGALVYARRGIEIDPSREDLYQAILRCQIQAGQRSAAIETFVQCKTLLADELGLDPSSDTIALYEQVLVMEEGTRRNGDMLGA